VVSLRKAHRKTDTRFTKAIGRRFAAALDAEMMRGTGLSYPAFTKRLRTLEKDFILLLTRQKWAQLEVRRRIEERLLEQAITRGCSLAVCRRRLDAVLQLGFESTEREAEFKLIYAKGALNRGRRIVAIRTAREFMPRLERIMIRRPNPMAKELLAISREFIAAIEEGPIRASKVGSRLNADR
jgi:hypothetical protein